MGILDGKVAIVTGAGHGIGRGHALELAKHGAKVVVNDLGGSVSGEGEGKDADLTVDLITSRGGEAVGNYENVADYEGAGRMIQQAVDTYGKLDILVNNAGIYEFAPLEAISAEHFHKQFDLDVLGLLLTTQEAVKHFGPSGGSINNISSGAAGDGVTPIRNERRSAT